MIMFISLVRQQELNANCGPQLWNMMHKRIKARINSLYPSVTFISHDPFHIANPQDNPKSSRSVASIAMTITVVVGYHPSPSEPQYPRRESLLPSFGSRHYP